MSFRFGLDDQVALDMLAATWRCTAAEAIRRSLMLCARIEAANAEPGENHDGGAI